MVGVDARHPAVREQLALSGRGTRLLREWVEREPGSGVARALWVLATSEALGDAELKAELVTAFEDAEGEWERSLVYGVYLHTHRQFTLAADHLAAHLARFPADEVAGLMLGAFHACGRPDHREAGDRLVVEQYRLAGSESWSWAGRTAWVRAEQGRVEEAWELAQHALALFPRSGMAVHARAHAEHELGAGPESIRFLDGWLAADPDAVQYRHLNWHAALQSLSAGDFDDARRRVDTVLAASDVGMRAATNWRLQLCGRPPARTTPLDQVRELLAAPGGTAEVFHTFQLALALAVHEATDDLEQLARAAEGDPRPAYAQTLAPVVRALAHITAGRHGAAVGLLTGLGTGPVGGVRVEREIIEDTLARALVVQGDGPGAARLLHHRTSRRRHHHYEDLLLAPAGPPSATLAARPAPQDRAALPAPKP
ncbi:hypothetical protein [Streptomyces sp. SID8358]|uniref:hypothetical protein n=1 Tax=unclassified Streptomyces TaxID=2593676 RepID=UPI000DAE3A6A|nr:hypothetical protein [Streptomyces sp. SID8358]MYX72983.1 hypothetical protein [Streptomyces sp. SID3915]